MAGSNSISEKKNDLLDMVKNKEPITLMHLWLMVFYKLNRSKYGNKEHFVDFLNLVLCTEIKNQIGYGDNEGREIRNGCEKSIMHKDLRPYYVKPETYTAIYDCLAKDPDESHYLNLYKQYDTLKCLEKEAVALWAEIIAQQNEYDNKSYFDILCERARWLFKDREEDWKKYDADRVYKLLTVAIAISLNQKTWTTKDDEDPEEPTDPLDILCRKFLYDGPPEELPDFTLRNVFETLFPKDEVFAVKRDRDDEYVIEEWDDVTYRDQLCILLPWLGTEYDLHPDSEDAAEALMGNKIVEPDIANRVLKFFDIFVAQTDYIWDKFIAHLKESLVKCSHARKLASDDEDDACITPELNRSLNSNEIRDNSKAYLNRLSKSRTTAILNRIARDKFWNGDQVDISLPAQWKSDKDVGQLYQYIAAYVLIALCCVKVEGSQKAEKRKAFKEALIRKIHNPTIVSIEEYNTLKEQNETLAQKLEHKERTSAETENSLLIDIANIVSTLLEMLPINSPIERQNNAEAFCRKNTNLNELQISKILNYLKVQDESKSLVRRTNPPGWDNGGK